MITIPGKIPIRIYPFFWLLIAIIGWINSNSLMGTAIWAVVIFFSVLIHEFGHALTAVAFKQKAYIELVGLGGVTHRNGPKLKLWQDFIIVLNGPIAGFLLFLGAYYIRESMGENPPSTLWTYTVIITMYANLFWTVINLLPIHPLDGGRLLSIILEALFGMRGIKLALLFSSILSLLVSLVFFSMGGLLAGSLFILLGFESYRAWKSSQTVSVQDHDTDLQKLLKEAQDKLRQGQEEEAKDDLQQIRSEAKEGVIYLMASEYLAGILNRKGAFKEAYDILDPLQDRLSPEGLRLLHQLAYHTGALKAAIALGSRSYQAYPNYETALTNAFSYSLLGEVQPAVGWLQRAITDGLPNFRTVLNMAEFDHIRNTPPFQELARKFPE